MKTWKFWFFGFLAFWFSGTIKSWSRVEFSGFLENRVELIELNDASPLNPNNQILDLADISDQLRLRLSIDTAAYSAAGVHARISYFDTPTDARLRHKAVVDEAFLNFDLPVRVNCILGKKRLAWGPSFLWNPTDVLSPPRNPQDPEPDENREGAFLMKLERSFNAITLTGLAAPEVAETNASQGAPLQKNGARLRHTQLVGKVDGLVYDTDLTGLVQYGWSTESSRREQEWRFGISFSRVFFGATEIHGELIGQRGQMRPSLTPDNLSLIEIPPSTRETDDSIAVGFVLGLHHSFSSNRRLILEYYHQDEGYSSTEIDRLVKGLHAIWMGSPQPWNADQREQYVAQINQRVSALTGNLRKNYAYLRLMQPRIDEVFTFEGNILWNLDDKSMLAFAEGEYETTTNIFAYLRGEIPINFSGEETSEFGGLGLRNASLRFGAKVYF